MPVMVTLAANPAYQPTAETKAVYDEIKKKGPFLVDYVTAMENIANSGGMYAVVSQAAESAKAEVRRIEDMSLDELKVVMLSLGIKPEKQMKRTDVVRLVLSKMTDIDIVEDGE